MSSRLTQFLLGLSLLLNLFVLSGFVYRSWIAPPMMGDNRPPGASPQQGNRPAPLELLAQELKLDDGQRAALREVFEKYGNSRRERQHETQKLRDQMAAELQKPHTDLTKLEPLVDQLSRVRAEQQKENLRAMVEIEPKLRPEQREHFEALLAERLGGWWGRPGGPRGQEGRPGGGRGRSQ